MKHFSMEQWVDYLRGLTGPAASAEMDLHLASGCAACRRGLESLRLAREGLRETVEVPEAFLARARAIFPASTALSPFERLLAVLTFDTLGAPLPAGVRGVAEARRVAFAVEDVKVELLIDPGPTRGGATLTGQISTATGSGFGPIRLLSGTKVLAETTATRFGEFELKFLIQAGMRLVIAEPQRRREIEVPLDLVPDRLRHPEKSEIKPPSGASEDM